jgi:hypothetical protein
VRWFRRDQVLLLEIERLSELAARQAARIRKLEQQKQLWIKVAVQIAQEQNKGTGKQ